VAQAPTLLTTACMCLVCHGHAKPLMTMVRLSQLYFASCGQFLASVLQPCHWLCRSGWRQSGGELDNDRCD
jgi:hypothetical protein